ncbi:MAG: nucleotidyl transferase AbiEii/AbiGii toxin family protein [Bacteroidetes bacterium CG02_land_8_20_14_3_00_31_25]|nr:nucleotidyl transferase AbiEii/AbiGii toxin family protein [Bacteroidota bacterium]PIV62058.1 MAG: nucleotidyl transferase AbiEii/AbiGii toxin family protein [Bacteroidetes bacterium CG02_land_8_20_14_3_00_31_25]PIX36144.1 MAG: nucleotidyl transferase AbiEii/AbiGii toxin family protein [Bacteroidetes bacterium CG_4_8_14_3_um_filter_31_14]
MIPEYAINEWRNTVPWNNIEQIEQDLVICRALVELFNDEFLSSHLAFRGGTALHKLYLSPQSRYSEDIDLVQIKAEPIKKTIIQISKVLSFLGKPVIKQKANNNTLVFRFKSEIPPIIPIRLKVETNCREHFDVLGLTKIEFNVKNQWFSGKCQTNTYKLDELLGTKLRALYQRRKGRDLYDIYKALSISEINVINILLCYRKYIEFAAGKPPTKKEFLLNMELKMKDEEFIGDTNMLLRNIEHYNPHKAYEVVKSTLLDKL